MQNGSILLTREMLWYNSEKRPRGGKGGKVGNKGDGRPYDKNLTPAFRTAES